MSIPDLMYADDDVLTTYEFNTIAELGMALERQSKLDGTSIPDKKTDLFAIVFDNISFHLLK